MEDENSMEKAVSANYGKNVLWNMIFSVLNAGQSMLLLMMVNRLAGEEVAGLFSFAFSVAVLMMNIGSYGIRNYQVSDVEEQHSFGEYCGFRFVTCGIMLLVSLGYVWIKAFDRRKTILILLLCGMRIIECFEDVFHGRYQQKQRLDIACRQGTIRILLSLVTFCGALMLTHEIVTAVVGYLAANLVCFVSMTVFTIPRFGGFHATFQGKGMTSLWIEGFPLFCGYFFSTYLGNAAKYAIDDFGTYQMQAYFNMIFMPVLVINLVSTMIFRPIIVDMATLWNQGEYQAFQKLVYKQLGYIGILALVMLPAAIVIGLPILSFFYGTALGDYRDAFFLLLSGGVFSAASSFLNVCIITIRCQRKLLLVIAFISMLAWLTGGIFVQNKGICGASCFYLMLTVIQAGCYLMIELQKYKSMRLVKQ